MLQYIDVSKIHPHPDNPRKDLGDLTELAESIKKQGILQNLTVVPWFSEITRAPADDDKMDGEYRVVIGHRRLAAAKIAGLTEVPCVISDMKFREQLGTMLLENLQRNDLTLYEQAQGFQMMLNFGDSVNDIAERTGFSETTIRRRVKLLELDSEKFKKSVERGATLLDYAELDKIKDAGLKNSVLDKIGTPNFQYELERAVDKEKAAENMAKLIAQLETFATRTDNSSGMRYVMGYYPSRDNKVTVPDDVDTTEYFYAVSDYGSVTLYTKYAQVKNEADTAEVEKRKMQLARKAALDDITKRAYQLRLKFVRDVSNTQAKKNMGAIVEYSLRAILDAYFDLDYDEFFEVLNVEVSEDEDEELNFGMIADRVAVSPERHLLVAIYLATDSGRENYYDWNGQYADNETLNNTYSLLERLGYEISDEERALRDGTHELFEPDDRSE